MQHLLLTLASLALLGVIAAQDYLWKPLRNETISAGLTGPYHWFLDASYVVLAIALIVGFRGRGSMEVVAVIAAVALLLTATTDTFGAWVDKLTGDKHSLWHSRFTLLTFGAALALQILGDHSWLWVITALNVALPAICYAYFHFRTTDIEGTAVAASPAAEKLFTLGLCVWLILWAM